MELARGVAPSVVAVVLAIVNVEVKTCAAPVVGVTTWVIVWVPSASLVVSQGLAQAGNPPA